MAKYSKGAGKKVKEAMHEMHDGKLKSGRSGKEVTSRKQAIAIGLSEARERGEKVPSKKVVAKKAASKKTASKKAAAKTGATKKVATKKTATKRGASKQRSR
jgi:topoisomerase IA-like protein